MHPIIIDVREPEEFNSNHYDGAVNIPLAQISTTNLLEKVHKDQPIVLYCRSGSRSGMALELLRQKGFSKLTNGINQDNVTRLLNTA